MIKNYEDYEKTIEHLEGHTYIARDAWKACEVARGEELAAVKADLEDAYKLISELYPIAACATVNLKMWHPIQKLNHVLEKSRKIE